MKPTDLTKQHVIARYVKPARLNGEDVVQVRVGTVQKELGWTNRTPSVFSTLSSREFQQEAGLELIERKGGPPSGGPSTTVQFVFRLLKEGDRSSSHHSVAKPLPNGAGLEKLHGVLKDAYSGLGGGESYLKSERNWGSDSWEQYEKQDASRTENRK